ncbi:acetyl-CoA carboxylase biotin carboxyl carrier protein [Angulomicrobium amanitiforme]|uniref:Biotin carboxyl carrier protein of acetyl-CoA carboxylase n=2 Tax=Ancylobacter amanitiformis TaxID=217069 RepID=A0ABU0LNC7_9HYPH|nr:acetyl-CoA carboxylase biotin carboxyl carrier protein [Ancylobacter amanitiformis]MDQ0510206.1 acetyl-CoA carboxylase biotin carboxyl carrier protein [Ancylobacter amanitiformis]
MMKTSKPNIDPALVREIANLLSESDLTEIEVQHEDLRIRVVRAAPTVYATAPAPAVAAPAPAAAPAAVAAPAASVDPAKHPGVVPSPMVGTAYLSPEPGARAFIEVGTVVKEGQTLLIVEAMKTMNAIPAPRAGTITRILVENAQPVEYGEPLVIIE